MIIQGTPIPQNASTGHLPPRSDFALVIPTFNERDNIPELIARLTAVLPASNWEVIFVDDDSPDGTAAVVREFARKDPRVRLLHRIGRRGLSTACIEGALATTANYIGIMDADMQHDETILPQMLQRLREDSLDIVVGTRNSDGGSMGEFSRHRVAISRLGQRISYAVSRCPLSDPMSGFFVFSRSFFLEVVHSLHGSGFKILVDMLASANRPPDHPVRFAEVGYTFRERRHGQSKLDVNTALEYLLLIIDKQSGGILPVRLSSFALVCSAALVTYLFCLSLFIRTAHLRFVEAQIASTYAVMAVNFFLNNLITWRHRSLRGFRLVAGGMVFCIACSFGAWASVIFAQSLRTYGVRIFWAGLAGIILSLVWNFAVSNLLVWQAPRRRAASPAHHLSAVYKAETSL